MRKITAAGIFLAILGIAALPQLSDAADIYGCVAKRDGSLRIVSNTSQCTLKETAIQWNQAGQQGPAGADGHSPVVSMSGDQITVDGAITGPHLTGPQGPAGTGSGVDGMSRVELGRVDGAGNVIVWASGSGFQVVKSTDGPGIYVINFTTPFNVMPICVCTLMSYDLQQSKLASCEIPFLPILPFLVQATVIVRGLNGSTLDAGFMFMCAEP